MEIVSESLALSPRVREGLEAVEESRLHKKPFWGEGLSVVTEETAHLPLVTRKALAIKADVPILPFLNVGASLQYVKNPGGIRSVPEAVVAGFRASITF